MTVLEIPTSQKEQLELEAMYLTMKIGQKLTAIGHLGSAVVLRPEVEGPDQYGNRGLFISATDRWTQEDVSLSGAGNPRRQGSVWVNLNKAVDIDLEARQIARILNARKSA